MAGPTRLGDHATSISLFLTQNNAYSLQFTLKSGGSAIDITDYSFKLHLVDRPENPLQEQTINAEIIDPESGTFKFDISSTVTANLEKPRSVTLDAENKFRFGWAILKMKHDSVVDTVAQGPVYVRYCDISDSEWS